MKQLYTYLYFAFLSMMFIFSACSDGKDTHLTYFPKPPEEKLDSIRAWLKQDSNYATAAYMPFFDYHFNRYVTTNQLDSAAQLLVLVGEVCYQKDVYDSILVQKYLDFLPKYEKANPQTALRAGLYRILAEFYIFKEMYEKAIATYKKNDFIPQDFNTAYEVGWSYYGLAGTYRIIAQYDSSILYGQKAMQCFEAREDDAGKSAVYSNLASVYRRIGDYQEAEKYALKNFAIVKARGEPKRIFKKLFDFVRLYDEAQSPLFDASVDSLVDFQKKTFPNDPQYQLCAQSVLAYRYLQDSNYLEVDKILKNIIPLFRLGINDGYFDKYYFFVLAASEIRHNKPLSLKKIYLQKYNAEKASKDNKTLFDYAEILGKDAARLNDYKKAYAYAQECQTALVNFQNTKVAAEAAQLEKKYQTERKEAQLQLQAEEALRKNVFIAMLLAGFVALFYFYYTLKKQNTIIAQQNELNEHTIAILSHDIKEPLLGVKLMLKKLNKDDPFVAQASQSLEGQINSVNGILTNLLKMKKLSLVKKDKNAQADVQAVVKNVLQELNVAIQTKELSIENDITEGVKLPIAPEKLQIIVHNLLSNAVKYSFPNQKIRIFQEGKGFCIQDFGIGLSPEQRSKLMREVTASQRGTSQERGNGMGLFLVGAMLQGENIKVAFDSPEVGGTIVKVFG